MDVIRWNYNLEAPRAEDQNIKYIDKHHKEIIKTFIRQMYTADAPLICPGGKLCLEGVNTDGDGDWYVTTPFDCPTGSYCLT